MDPASLIPPSGSSINELIGNMGLKEVPTNIRYDKVDFVTPKTANRMVSFFANKKLESQLVEDLQDAKPVTISSSAGA